MTHQRLFSIREHFTLMKRAACGLRYNRINKAKKAMNKQRRERIMLAISEVNGCAMCSYVHTKLALQAQMTPDEIKEILSGELAHVPEQDVLAVLFAKDFAASHEVIDSASYRKIQDFYGTDGARAIVCASHVITMTTSMGISLALLKDRLLFKSHRQSHWWNELLIPLSTLVLFPMIYVVSLFSKPINHIGVLSVE